MIARRAMRRMQAEDGVAMIVAMGALSVLLILSAFAFGASSQLSTATNDQHNAKRAFQAADAGLQVATYRVNNLVQTSGLSTMCLVQAGGALSSGCSAGEQLADGASWSYQMTPELTTGNLTQLLPDGKCAGFPVQFASTGELVLLPRCITATGTANGVTRRVQARVSLFKGSPLFASPNGMVGLTGITLKNSSGIAGGLGSNGLVSMGNGNTVTGGITIGPQSQQPQVGTSQITGGVTRRTNEQGPFVLSPVEVGNSATVNNNATLVSSGAASYNSSTRVADFSNGKVTLAGGDYNLCQANFSNNTTIVVPQGARVRLFIDSPTRSGSGCAAGTGRFVVGNSLSVLGNPDQFQLYVYGPDVAGQPAVDINNAAELNMAIHAPSGSVVAKNASNFSGGVNANYIEFKNTTNFNFDNSLLNLQGVTSTLFQRSAWRQCRSAPTTAGQPHSGC